MREYVGMRAVAAPVAPTPNQDEAQGCPVWADPTLDLVDAEQGVVEEGRLARQLHEARSAETVGRFAVSIAHDFNSLCTAMIYFAEVANSCVQAGGDPSTVIGHIADTAQSASELSRQILSFSRDQRAEPSAFELDAGLADLEPLLGCLIGPERTLRIDPLGRGAHIKLASSHFRQIVLNLLVNAHDATDVGGCVTVETDLLDLTGIEGALAPRVLPTGRYAVLRVTDTGQGMDARTLARCFEPFFTTKGLGQGTGIGLATVRDIVQMYGGTVIASSAVGRGSTFTVYLPVPDDEPERLSA
jgi:two-component system, cell cycle sensor histidine kinase and response regulator CckA